MKGFIIFQRDTAQLLYSRNYNCAPFTAMQNQSEDLRQSMSKQKITAAHSQKTNLRDSRSLNATGPGLGGTKNDIFA